MILRITHKLARKIKVYPEEALERAKNPFSDWTANFFTLHDFEFIIICNTATLYTVMMPGENITNDDAFILGGLKYMREYMKNDDLLSVYQRHIVTDAQTVYFSKTGDKRVLGSMKDQIDQARFCLTQKQMSPVEANRFVNQNPLSIINYKSAREAFLDLKVRS